MTAGGSLLSNARVGKCSRLHSQSCALSDWQALQQCAVKVTSSTSWMSAANFTSNQGWEQIGPAITQSLGSSFANGQCQLSTRIGVGLDCGLGSQPYSSLSTQTNATVCWLLSVSTSTSVASTCSGSHTGKSKCASSQLTMIIPETLISSEQVSSVQCPAQTVTPIACTGLADCGSRPPLSLPQTTLSASPDLSTAFTLSDGSLCGGDFYRPNIGSTCVMIRYQLSQTVDGGDSFTVETSSSSSSGSFAIQGLWFGPSVLDQMSFGAISFPVFARNSINHTCSP